MGRGWGENPGDFCTGPEVAVVIRMEEWYSRTHQNQLQFSGYVIACIQNVPQRPMWKCTPKALVPWVVALCSVVTLQRVELGARLWGLYGEEHAVHFMGIVGWWFCSPLTLPLCPSLVLLPLLSPLLSLFLFPFSCLSSLPHCPLMEYELQLWHMFLSICTLEGAS